MNTLSTLNNHLFQQLERLNNANLSKEELATEIERSKAVSGVAKDIISNARLVLDAKTSILDLPEKTEVPKLLT